MRWRRILMLSLVVLASLTPGVRPVQAQDVAGSSNDAVDVRPLSDCLSEGDRGLSVLFLMDTSLSLRSTDSPTSGLPIRVQGVTAAIKALSVVAGERDVYASFLEFGSTASSSFPQWEDWRALRSSEDEALELVEQYATRTTSEDTDYGIAVRTADQVLSQAPKNTCRLMVWFTDGKIEIDYINRAKEVAWLNPPFPVLSESDQKGATDAVISELCKPGGLADGLRGDGDLAGKGVYVAAVGFGDPEKFGFLGEVALNTEGFCGKKPGVGSLILVDQLDPLARALIRAVDPPLAGGTKFVDPEDAQDCLLPPDAAESGAFGVPSSLESLRFRVEWAGSLRPVLVSPGPDGAPVVTDIGASTETTLSNGARLTVRQEVSQQVSVSLTLPDDPVPWAGTWEFRYCTATADQPFTSTDRMAVSLQDYAGGLELRVIDGVPLRRTREGEIALQLVSRQGTARSSSAWDEKTQVVVKPVPGVDFGQDVDVSQSGAVRVSALAKADASADLIKIDVEMRAFARIFPMDEPKLLSEWRGTAGSVEVKDIPKHPILVRDADFPVLDQTHLVSEATYGFESVGPESGGCVSVESVSFADPDSHLEPPEVSLVVDGKEIEVGSECGLKISQGESADLVVRATVSKEASRVAESYEGTLNVRLDSSTDPSQGESESLAIKLFVEPQTIVDPPDPESLIGAFLLAVLMPLLLLYGYNAFWGAKLAVRGSMVAATRVVFSNGRLFRLDDDGSRRPLVIEQDDLDATSLTDERTRSVSVGGVQFAARIPATPWGHPHAVACAPNRSLAIAQDGMSGDPSRGASRLTLHRAWAFVSDRSAILINDSNTIQADESDDWSFSPMGGGGTAAAGGANELEGLLVVLPGLGSSAVAAANDICREAESVIAEIVDDGVRPSWREKISAARSRASADRAARRSTRSEAKESQREQRRADKSSGQSGDTALTDGDSDPFDLPY